jgi:hypothetical protein
MSEWYFGGIRILTPLQQDPSQMRKWFIFGIIVAAIGALALLWYLNRDD